MYPVSSQFLDALRSNHTITIRAELLRDGLKVADIDLSGGSITDDSTALVRRRAQLALPHTLVDQLPQSVPSNGGLWPLGNELKVFQGIRFRDDSVEEVPLGVYRIAKPVLKDTGRDLTLTVDGYDRMRTVQRARFVRTYNVVKGTNYATAIKDLILSRIPTLDEDNDFIFMETTHVTPDLIFTNQDDPAQMAANMAASIGAELFFDGNGKCVLRPETDPSSDDSSFDYVEGEDTTLTSVTRDLDDESAYNGVIVTGQSPTNNGSTAGGGDKPVRAEAWDTNPTSPTYYDPARPQDSRYGAVPYFMDSQYITTNAQAQDAADAQLLRVVGIIEDVSFEAIVNFAHQSNDVVRVTRKRIGVDDLYKLESFSFGLGHDSVMSGTTRKRNVSS